VPKAKTGGFRQSKETFRCFVIEPINCHSESENFLKLLLTRANFSEFNPGDGTWRFRHRGIPVPKAKTGGFRQSKENISLFCHRADKLPLRK
jgi:hypothetical protein